MDSRGTGRFTRRTPYEHWELLSERLDSMSAAHASYKLLSYAF
jgi:hypothetical protein